MAACRIVLFSCEPGGAECLVSAAAALRAGVPGAEVVLSGYGHALAVYDRYAAAHDAIEPSAALSGDLVAPESVRLVVTSATSLPWRDMSERRLWRHARARGVPSIAFVDHWQDYALRFSGPAEDEKLAYLPDFANCIDVIGREEAIAEGIPPERIVCFGHPALGAARDRVHSVDRAALARAQGLGNRACVLFVSEPILENYGASRGYDQYVVLDMLARRMRERRPAAVLLVKPHPKDEPERLASVLARHARLESRLLDSGWSSTQAVAVSDSVIGMTSVVLVEAFLAGRKVASLQPGLAGNDRCVLTRRGLAPLLGADTFDPLEPGPCREASIDVRFRAEEFVSLAEGLLARAPR